MKGTKWHIARKRLFNKTASLCRRSILPFFFLPLLTACSLIDDDLSDCGKEAKIDYELRLITNMSIELETQLDSIYDKDVKDALKTYLKNIFTDYAHDVDLSFYDTKGDSTRLYHDQHIMDASQQSYTLYLPMREYMHLTAANLVNNPQVSLVEDGWCHPSKLLQQQSDTITPHTTGLFTARLPMDVKEKEDQTFTVKLYMANCAAALVLDTQGYDTEGMQVIANGFATGFNINDSTYSFGTKASFVKADRVNVKNSRQACFCSVNFPSREPEATRTVIETEEPFIAKPDEHSLWELRVYVPRPVSAPSRAGGSITETVLSLNVPLRAGELKIIRGRVNADGRIVPDTPEVGVSVTLDWKPGNTYTPEL